MKRMYETRADYLRKKITALKGCTTEKEVLLMKNLQFELIQVEKIIKYEKEQDRKEQSEKEIINQHGGKRFGAGRKLATGMNTEVMRVPNVMKKYILSFIDMYADWLNESESETIKLKTTKKDRTSTLMLFECLMTYHKEKLYDKNIDSVTESK